MKNEKKYNGKRRLLLLILLLVCTLILLGSSTYAWFTANTKVAIQPMDIEVEVANGIEISADAVHWSSRITKADLYKAAGIQLEEGMNSSAEHAGAVNQFPTELKNVSSVGNVGTNNRLELFSGDANNICYDLEEKRVVIAKGAEVGANEIALENCNPDYTPAVGLLKAETYAETNGSCRGKSGEFEGSCGDNVQVMAFDIYLKLDNDSFVALAPGSYVSNKENLTDFGLKNTVRVAFVTLGTQPSDFYYAEDKDIAKQDTSVQGLAADEKATGRLVKKDGDMVVFDTKGDIGNYGSLYKGYAGYYGARRMNGFGGIDIWEPNSTYHTRAALDNASKNYGITELGNGEEAETYGLYAAIPADLKEDPSDTDPNAQTVLPMFLKDTKENTTYFAKQQEVTETIKAQENSPYKNLIHYIKTGDKVTQEQALFAAYRGVTKLRVYIWIEGQDIDTENIATSSKVQAMLSFTTAFTDGRKPTAADFEKYTNVIDPVWNTTATGGIKDPQDGGFDGTTTP